jgi:putative flavoprotein involved in K+ transport
MPRSTLPSATHRHRCPRLQLDLRSGEIRTIIWATGFRPDYRWLDVPVLDAKGQLRHDGGVVDSPGLYALGLPVLRRRKSTFIHGIEDDARDVIEHLTGSLPSDSRVRIRPSYPVRLAPRSVAGQESDL